MISELTIRIVKFAKNLAISKMCGDVKKNFGTEEEIFLLTNFVARRTVILYAVLCLRLSL